LAEFIDELKITQYMYVIKFENAGKPYWIASGDGDPPRTLREQHARKYETYQVAEKALKDILKQNFHRYRGKDVDVQIIEV
jgi:hypothetical protein